ncbi:MAG: hypothetical protein NW224_12660 [Leptolyngbyaceae cyanobacterium bins.302]|nr:hypothetical protein [Leptolyngbyaceae cyanobacterium bins.302]
MLMHKFHSNRSTFAFAKLSAALGLKPQDTPWIASITAMAGWFFYRHPVLSFPIAIGVAFTVLVMFLDKQLQVFNRFTKLRLRPWYILVPFAVIAFILNTLQPAHAIFLSGLQEFIAEIATESAAGGEGVSEDTIELVFNIIRAIFLLLVAVAALFAYNQAQQGNDWRPIAGQIALAFGVVLGLDVITALFVQEA